MAENNSDKKKVWIYAIVLFTSAFVVLLLTAVSQIKLNKNISDYKTQIHMKEKEKSNFQLNLSSSENQNKKLQEELKATKENLKNELENNKEDIKKYNELETKHKRTVEAFEKLILAESEYDNKNFAEAALILLKQCDSDYLSNESLNKYFSLKEKVYKIAARQFYVEGFKEYKRSNYSNAILKFQYSIDLIPDEYYSDDCIFFMAYSFYKNGNNEDAEKNINILFKNYPDSTYINDAQDLLKNIKG
ncbi:MAG: hypothetical protein N3I35_02620 [Clostridia bacterium]|nr:hypothetical protein [Clostridia bacterium]